MAASHHFHQPRENFDGRAVVAEARTRLARQRHPCQPFGVVGQAVRGLHLLVFQQLGDGLESSPPAAKPAVWVSRCRTVSVCAAGRSCGAAAVPPAKTCRRENSGR